MHRRSPNKQNKQIPDKANRINRFVKSLSRPVLLAMIGSIVVASAGVSSYFFMRAPAAKQAVAIADLKRPEQTVKSADEQKVDTTPGETKRDIEYCSKKLLDMYEPRTLRFKRSPVVMYLHGGGWALNDKASEQDQLAMIDGLRDEGYTVVSIDYHIIPTGYFPRAVEDTLCAVRFLRANAETYFLDKNKVAAYGFSAGGYLASMAGVVPEDSEYETDHFANQSSRVSAVVTLAGIFDFTDGLTVGNRERIANFLNGADPGRIDVMNYISADDAPHLLLHGAEDQSVPVTQDELLAEQLLQYGVRHERHLIQFAEHGLNPAGGEPTPSRDEVKQLMAAFIRRELENPTSPE